MTKKKQTQEERGCDRQEVTLRERGGKCTLGFFFLRKNVMKKKTEQSRKDYKHK
jgi:hypothetical protein